VAALSGRSDVVRPRRRPYAPTRRRGGGPTGPWPWWR
jgi:hypothetical protein